MAALAMGSAAMAAEAERETFGTLPDGRAVEAVVLRNANGVSARVIALGATLQSLSAPDRSGRVDDIVLGYDDAARYLEEPQYFGVTVGRYANRIANGRFDLDGEPYQLEINDGANHLHGGLNGFDKQLWEIAAVESGEQARVVLTYVSPDGEGGYPGTLTAQVTYALNDDNELTIDHRARTDAPTIVNLTNHSYFNLGGHAALRSVMDHRLTIHASAYTPVDAGLIPTGEIRTVAETAFDFTTPTPIGARIRDAEDEQLRLGRGYDHNFVLDGEPGALRPAARLEDPDSGRVLELLATAPGVQFYSGNFLDGRVVGKGGVAYRQGDGLCLEPQTFPDAPNRASFPSPRLDPGEEYQNTMVLRLSTTDAGARGE
jgi:aldose 1-epimerase